MIPLRVLFTASEIFPMAKTGGLGDVAAGLPVALRDAGADVRLLMPAYPSALAAVMNAVPDRALGNIYDCGNTDAVLAKTPASGMPIYLVRNQSMFERDGDPYHDAAGQVWPDNAQRFALLSAAAAAIATDRSAAWQPDLVHANDWHTALVPSLIAARASSRPGCILTIHNAVYQENLQADQIERFGVANAKRDLRGVVPSFLSIGIADADSLTTVSPTYAAEIQTPEFGCGLERLIAARAAVLRGILNGIDDSAWNPQTDAFIAARYSLSDLGGKATCKLALLAERSLSLPAAQPLLACVSRLTWQKGLDVLLGCLPELLSRGMGFVLLGTGDAGLEAGFRAIAQRFPATSAARIEYDEAMAHRIIAGADIFVMPSRFEPCGLNQMYSQRYGTIPVVHAVGGLADTVRDVASAAGTDEAAGFTIPTLTQATLIAALAAAARCYSDRSDWLRLQRNAMRQDFSWAKSAQAYLRVYDEALSSAPR